jgi:ribosomal-protein-serine acetyltransferase
VTECRGTGAPWRELPGGAQLRLLDIDDAAELHSAIEANREHLELWLPWAAGQTFDDTVAFLDRTRRQLEGNDGFQVAILREDRLAGVIGYHSVDWSSRSTGIGYWLAASEQGKGTMTEAVTALVDHAFSVWRLNRVEIRAATENRRSNAIPERLGFQREGTLRQAERVGGRYLDLVVYSMLAADWLTQSRAPDR